MCPTNFSASGQPPTTTHFSRFSDGCIFFVSPHDPKFLYSRVNLVNHCVSLVSTTTISPDGKQLPIQSKVRAFVVWQSTLCLVPCKYHYDTTTGCHLQCLEAITQVNGGSAHAFPPLVCCYVSLCRILTFMLASEKTYGTNIRQGYATFWLFRL